MYDSPIYQYLLLFSLLYTLDCDNKKVFMGIFSASGVIYTLTIMTTLKCYLTIVKVNSSFEEQGSWKEAHFEHLPHLK